MLSGIAIFQNQCLFCSNSVLISHNEAPLTFYKELKVKVEMRFPLTTCPWLTSCTGFAGVVDPAFDGEITYVDNSEELRF